MLWKSNYFENYYYYYLNNYFREWDKDVGRDTASYLLPGLQKLRQICNNSTEDLVFATKRFSADDIDANLDDGIDSEEFNYGVDSEEINTKKKRKWTQPQPSTTTATSTSTTNNTTPKSKTYFPTSTTTTSSRKQIRSDKNEEKTMTIDLEGSSKLKVDYELYIITY